VEGHVLRDSVAEAHQKPARHFDLILARHAVLSTPSVLLPAFVAQVKVSVYGRRSLGRVFDE